MGIEEVFISPDALEWADIHAGETAIVLGSGKSLNDIPRELLEKYPSFGVNHIYLLPFQPTYFCSIDSLYLQKYAREMRPTAERAKIAFINEKLLGAPGIGLRELFELDNACLYGEDTVAFPGEYAFTGETVAYVALKIAYAMGFTTVLLVGCDRDEDWEYFSKDYPAEHIEIRSKLNWEAKKRGMEHHFAIAGLVYQDDGRRIINFSIPSKIDEYFERGNIEDW